MNDVMMFLMNTCAKSYLGLC